MTRKSIPGRLCKAYVNTGTYASPTWLLLKYLQDLETPMEKGKIEIADRSSSWDKVAPGNKAGRVTFTYRKRRGADAGFDKLLDAFVDDSILDVLVLDGAVDESGAMGWRLPVGVYEAGGKQPLKDGVSWSFGCEIEDTDSSSGVVFEPAIFEVA